MNRHHGCVIGVAALTLLFAPAVSADPGQEGVNQRWGRDRTQTFYRRTSLIRARRGQFQALVNETARNHRLRPELLHAIIEVESGYDPTAVSPAGAVGLMQLMPTTAARYGVSHPTDPVQNIAGGAAYLRDLQVQFGNDLRLVLAAYNAGEDAVERFQRQIPPYAETQAYVRRVVDLLRRRSSMVVRREQLAVD